jgi:HNH endonuclease
MKIPEGVKSIPLTRGRVAWVSKEDYTYLSQWSWCFSGKYAIRSVHPRKEGQPSTITVQMHKEVMRRMLGGEIPAGFEVDHENLDKTCNWRDNLRLATESQNCMNTKLRVDNTSGYRGVSICKSTHRGKHVCGRWAVQIQADKKKIMAGCFDKLDEALLVRDKLARQYHGEFAVYNIKRFPRVLRFPREAA